MVLCNTWHKLMIFTLKHFWKKCSLVFNIKTIETFQLMPFSYEGLFTNTEKLGGGIILNGSFWYCLMDGFQKPVSFPQMVQP